MLTNNLLCPIAFDTLGAGIPIRDDPFRIQHVNSVIRHTPDEQPEASFAVTKPRHRLRQLGGAFHDALFKHFIEAITCLVNVFGSGNIKRRHIYSVPKAFSAAARHRGRKTRRSARSFISSPPSILDHLAVSFSAPRPLLRVQLKLAQRWSAVLVPMLHCNPCEYETIEYTLS